MRRYWDTAVAILRAGYNLATVIATAIGAIILAVAGFLGPQADTKFGHLLQAVSLYRLYLAVPLFAVASFFAVHKSRVEAERSFYATNARGRMDRVKSELARLILRGEELAGGNDAEAIAKWDEDTRRVLSFYLIPSVATKFSDARANPHDVAIRVLKTYFHFIMDEHITWRGVPDHP